MQPSVYVLHSPVLFNGMSSILTFLLLSDDQTSIICLDLEALKSLNKNIGESWNMWVQSAPQSWKDDAFITDNSPIAITSRYGQDELLGTGGQVADEWQTERCFENIRYVNFAIATDVE